jgi:hypothetical protein
MTNRFLISVAAAALIAGTGFANAQGTGMSREGGSSAGSTMQSAPSSGPSSAGSSAGQMSHESTESKSPEATKPSSGMKATQSDQKTPSAAKNDRAEDMQKSKSMNSENDAKGGAKDMKAEGREDRGNNMKAEGREDRNGGMKAEGREDSSKMKAEGREDRNGSMKAEGKSSTTVGQAGAGAKLSTEQRTKITTVIRDQHVAPVNNVNFSISIGTRVPREVSFHTLPAEVVTVYPEWRGYEFFLVRDQIVVVDPRTLEIVAVLEA